MRKNSWTMGTALIVLALSVLIATQQTRVEGQSPQQPSFAAVPGQKGGQDILGAYEAVPNWPKSISSLPGNEKWIWGAGQGVFAESPNRVFILQRGELPNLQRPKTISLPQLGLNIEVPVGGMPGRDGK